jgi:hypothetical protein
MRFVNEPVSVEARVSADGTLQPLAFEWEGCRFVVADYGRTWVENGIHCFLVMTPAQEIFELRQFPDGRWILARALERPHLA